MTFYLLSISIGPVQEFIAAARKTADLFAGSQLLQEVVAAAANKFDGAESIFPAKAGDGTEKAKAEGGGANKILAVIQGDSILLAQRAKAAEDAARGCLLDLWKTHSAELGKDIHEERAEAQLKSFLEVYAAWVPTTDATYAKDRETVERLLAGRKALRNFDPLNQDDAGVPKSPLDPAYASVLALEGLQVARHLQNDPPFNFKASETLDAVSLLKREFGRREPKIRGKVLNTHTLAHRARHPEAPNSEQEDFKPDYAYFAILMADGDNMGKLLDGKNRAEHIEVSKSLDAFADEAKKIVADCHGFCIYAGGDDVLALLPVTTALECGRELSDAFRTTVYGGEAKLSAGIAIVHYREPLSTSLGRARAAEKAAKAVDGKDAVSVALHTRGGVPLYTAMKWDESSGLHDWQKKAQDGELPRGLPYELAELAREWPKDFDPTLLTAEARRIARRKVQQDGQKLSDEEVKVMIPDLNKAADLKELSERLILARFLSGKGEA